MSKKEEMFALVAQWRQSGLTRKTFANQQGLKSESFNYWCKKQYGEVVKGKVDRSAYVSDESPSAKPEFIELTAGLNKNIQSQPIRMELDLPGGIHIKIY